MRVLLVTDWLSERGGVEAYTTWLRAGLQGTGDEVRLLTSRTGSVGDGAADFVAWATERVAAQAFLQIVNPLAVARVREALKVFRPDVAIVNMFALHLSPAILRPLRSIPTVLSVNEYKVICPIGSKLLPDGKLCAQRAGRVCWRSGCVSIPHWLRDQPRYALIRAGVRGVDRVLACSRWVERELALNAIESEHLALPVPAPGPSFRRVPADHPAFMFCGGLRVEKGVPLLLRAFARLRSEMPTATLRIVGQGPQRPALERLVGSLALSEAVTFTGWLAPPAVEQELAGAWALVTPSLWAEPLGLVALEAIVRGVPVIASRAGGLGEVVEDGVSGLLFPNGDEETLLRHLRAVAGGAVFPTHTLAEDVSRRAASVYSMETHIARLRGILEEVRSRRASAGAT